jgi:hypothetical protein
MIPRSSDPELRHPPLPALHATESLSSASGRSGGAVNPRIMSAFGAEPPPAARLKTLLERLVFWVERPLSNAWRIRVRGVGMNR